MTATTLVLAGQYHLGDNPGLFQDATFVGYVLALPLTVTLDSDEPGADATFHVETHDVETWGPDEWQGHPVRLTGAGGTHELGRLKDPDDTSGRVERFRLSIGKAKLEELLGGRNGSVVLTVEVEKRSATPGIADDFVLTRLETTGMIARIGAGTIM